MKKDVLMTDRRSTFFILRTCGLLDRK